MNGRTGSSEFSLRALLGVFQVRTFSEDAKPGRTTLTATECCGAGPALMRLGLASAVFRRRARVQE